MEMVDRVTETHTPANLDNLLSEFNQWQKCTFDMLCEKALLVERLDLTNKLVADADKRESSLREELEGLKMQINRLQSTLTRRCDLEDKNHTLNKDIEECQRCLVEKEELYENRLKTQAKANETVIERFQTTITDLKSTHQEDIMQLRISLKEEAEAEKAEIREQLKEKYEETSGLYKQIEAIEHQKQTDMARIRLECDEKLSRIQKQASRQPLPSAGRNQDIYRQKLQHAKAESEREIAHLKQTIMELQGKLEMQRAKQHSTQPGPARPPPQKRARNY